MTRPLRVLRAGAIRRAAAGGQTSLAMIAGHGISALDVGPKIAAGVPLILAPQPGEFGTPDVFVEVLTGRRGSVAIQKARGRKDVVLLARTLFERGATPGATGNVGAHLADESLLMLQTTGSDLYRAFFETRTGTMAYRQLAQTAAPWLLTPKNLDDAVASLSVYAVMRPGGWRCCQCSCPSTRQWA